jgi:hypothetical protein
MTKKKKVELYNLRLEAGSSCFKSFAPEIYTEVRGYNHNSAFENEDARALLDLANRALVFFTRGSSEYEFKAQEKYSYISAKKKRQALKENIPENKFDVLPSLSFKRKRDDFEEAVLFCLKNLQHAFDPEDWSYPKNQRTGHSDTQYLTLALSGSISGEIDAMGNFVASSGNTYNRQHVLAAFSLWKIDRILLALKYNAAADVGKLLIDAQAGLVEATKYYATLIQTIEAKKSKSNSQAQKGNKRHQHLNKFKNRAIEIYIERGALQKWKNRNSAARLILRTLEKENGKEFLSEDEKSRTMTKWLLEADHEGKLLMSKK